MIYNYDILLKESELYLKTIHLSSIVLYGTKFIMLNNQELNALANCIEEQLNKLDY